MPADRSELSRSVASLRATRAFADEAVPENLLDEVLDVARWTGSARNRQPWRFVVVRAAADRARFARLGAYAQHLAGAPVLVLLALDVSTADAEFDGGRVAQSLMLAAHALGLGSCPATFFPDENAAMATDLAGFAPPWRVRTAISLGWPARGDDAAAARPATAVRSAIPTGRLPLGELRRDLPSRD